MTCKVIKSEGSVTAIFCSRAPKVRCYDCAKMIDKRDSFLCDYTIDLRRNKTCDAVICDECRMTIMAKDFCKKHQPKENV